jgi:nitrogenase molybdenum-iron protein NifN
MGESIATLVIGRSIANAANRLEARTGVPTFRFDHLIGLDACDAFTQTLAELSGQPVPAKIERQRSQLQDAMVDTHFMTGFLRDRAGARSGSAERFVRPVRRHGRRDCHRRRSRRARKCSNRCHARAYWSAILKTSKFRRPSTERNCWCAIPTVSRSPIAWVFRCCVPAFPLYDWVGGYARGWVGYRHGRQALFDIANLFLGQHHDIPAYRSIFRTETVPAAVPSQAGAGVVRH